MNKQEAINELMSKSREIIFGDDENVYLSRKRTIELISQIHEPQKVVVPKFVAEWIEDHKGDYNKQDEEAKADFVFRSINDLFRFGEGFSPWDFTIDKKFSEWTTKNAYKFITAILFGCEIEKEPLYTVEIPNPNSNFKYTFLAKKDNRGVLIYKTDDDCWKADKINQLTESEIKQDFEWAWQWAVPVEEN